MSDPISHPVLFDMQETITGVAELFPNIWIALENLASPTDEVRSAALEKLLALDAIRISPLAAYVTATRIVDSNLELRFRVVQALGDILNPVDGKLPARAVRDHLKNYLSRMRNREIFALLQIAERYLAAESSVAALLNCCSYAGNALSEIILDRKAPLEIRRQAINFTGLVGFLDCAPALQKLASRLEARANGQRTMPFAPPTDGDEKSLLPAVQSALAMLQAP